MDELAPVLIANRGEIAVRVARTLAELGLRSVGVFTGADAQALHVDRVDRELPRISSYLSIPDLLGAAQRTGARAIHPGYGFLSENAGFAQAVLDAGLVWIGPPPAAIELMGDKGRAKQAAAAAEVPVIPDGTGQGFPVVVKAVAGGGGKGMRVVRSAAELSDATEAAKREALAAFGDDRVIVERWIERPRHIEIQVLADAHGSAIQLGERECSLQRRHQKVIEEAPSPVVTPDRSRARMGAAATNVALARGVRLRRRRHGRVHHAGRRVRVLLPGDEHPPAGRAPGHRARLRRRPRRAPAPRTAAGEQLSDRSRRRSRRRATRSRRGSMQKARRAGLPAPATGTVRRYRDAGGHSHASIPARIPRGSVEIGT